MSLLPRIDSLPAHITRDVVGCEPDALKTIDEVIRHAQALRNQALFQRIASTILAFDPGVWNFAFDEQRSDDGSTYFMNISYSPEEGDECHTIEVDNFAEWVSEHLTESAVMALWSLKDQPLKVTEEGCSRLATVAREGFGDAYLSAWQHQLLGRGLADESRAPSRQGPRL